MSQPAVSVIMNCLNGEKDLPAALESVREQTYQNLEIIFWDNCSTDASAAIARAYGPKLRYFKSESTISLGAARNLAIAEARGEYIAFLDCDDLWRPTKLEKQMALFDRNQVLGLVCTDTEIFNGKRVLNRVFSSTKPARGHVFSELMTRQWISMSSAVIRKKALDDMAGRTPGHSDWFDEKLHVCEEADVFYRVAHDWELDYIDEPLTVWRVHGANTTFREFDRFAAETLLILDKHRRLYPGYDQDYAGIASLLERRATFQRAIAMWRSGENGGARKLARPLLKLSPKYRLFWLATFFPGKLFNFFSRLYFALPGRFRR